MPQTIEKQLHIAGKNAKHKILNNLGGTDTNELVKILNGHLSNDSFRDNGMNMFKRAILHDKERCNNNSSSRSNSFGNLCAKFAKNQIADNYSKRLIKSFFAIPGYTAASVLFLTGNPIASLGVAIANTGLSGIAESREKRNIATIGHGQEYISESCVKTIKEIYEQSQDNLTPVADQQIKKALGIKDKSAIGSKVARYTSYISGPFVSGLRSIYSTAKSLSNTAAFNVAFGIVAPIMPLVNTGVSYIAAKLRQRSMNKKMKKFEKVTEILCDHKNYKNVNPSFFNKIIDKFKEKMEQPHCQDKGKYLSGDRNTNVRKSVMLSNWIGNKIRNIIPSFKKLKTCDITKEPKNFDKIINKTTDQKKAIDTIQENLNEKVSMTDQYSKTNKRHLSYVDKFCNRPSLCSNISR